MSVPWIGEPVEANNENLGRIVFAKAYYSGVMIPKPTRLTTVSGSWVRLLAFSHERRVRLVRYVEIEALQQDITQFYSGNPQNLIDV